VKTEGQLLAAASTLLLSHLSTKQQPPSSANRSDTEIWLPALQHRITLKKHVLKSFVEK